MTDRTIRAPADLDGLDFDKQAGLVPLIVQDARSGEVLMLGYANREAMEATLESGRVHFWSRSRGELWMKGVTSGNVLSLVGLHGDCDGDAVLARVEPSGPVCHTGEVTCFGEGIEPGGLGPGGGTRVEPTAPGLDADPGAPHPLTRLDATLARRAAERPEGSYTTRLLADSNLRLKKLGEETAELVTALATNDASGAVEEAADLVYHVLVALRAEGAGVDALLAELERRVR
jgi:phosphoribosyl-ATP pyrophosphohydrolase/phosphoribosyl-AMP cyclohydrolase